MGGISVHGNPFFILIRFHLIPSETFPRSYLIPKEESQGHKIIKRKHDEFRYILLYGNNGSQQTIKLFSWGRYISVNGIVLQMSIRGIVPLSETSWLMDHLTIHPKHRISCVLEFFLLYFLCSYWQTRCRMFNEMFEFEFWSLGLHCTEIIKGSGRN